MSLRLQFISNLLWIAQPILLMAVGGAMFWRKLYKTFPVFFIYIISQIITFMIVYPASTWGSYAEFFYSYWIAAAISLAIGFKILHEVFLDVFRPYHTLKDLGSLLFRWGGLVMLLVAIVVAASTPTSVEEPLVQSVLTVQRCVRVIQVGLVLFLLTFSRYLGVNWKQKSFGIALGFGLAACVEMLAVGLHIAGYIGTSMSGLVNTSAYDVSILIWLGYAVVKQTARESRENLLTTQRWEQSLTELQRPTSPDSLIPMFEGMVDRALSRSRDPLDDDLELKPEPTSEKFLFDIPMPEIKTPPKR
jgi:hypothetical protein